MADSLIGREAPALALEDTTGRLHRLAESRGRWVLLVFHRHLG